MKKFTNRMEFRPLLSLVIILLICAILSGGDFFKLQIVEGHLYGRLIDILRNGSKYVVLAIGMTMVLATGGTDISVGSVMAISGALACSIVDERILAGLGGNVGVARGAGPAGRRALRRVERLPCGKAQGAAHRCDHDPADRRPRYRAADRRRPRSSRSPPTPTITSAAAISSGSPSQCISRRSFWCWRC